MVSEIGQRRPIELLVFGCDGIFVDRRPAPQLDTALGAVNKRKCLASNGSAATVTANLESAGLQVFFENAIYCADEVGSRKPDPELMRHAAGAMEVDPGRCLVIEDSVDGVRSALAAGMRVIGFAPDDDAAATLKEEGIQVFNNMLHLPYLVFVLESGGSNSTS